MFEKGISFARNGNGRRLLNLLNKKDAGFNCFELDEMLRTYGKHGLDREVSALKKRRGILTDAQYHALAQAVRDNCGFEQYDAFARSLRALLSCGMKMNPARTDGKTSGQS